MQEIPYLSRLIWPNRGSKWTPGSVVLREARSDARERGSRDCRHARRGGERQPRLGVRRLYEGVYCARGQAENLIKRHRVQVATDRTSCQSPLANQFRLVLHTTAHWLMLTLRDAVPRRMPLAWAEFTSVRQSLLKIGPRVPGAPRQR